MNADPIKTICVELERKLIESRENRVTGTLVVELSMRQGGIGSAHINTHIKETLRIAAK